MVRPQPRLRPTSTIAVVRIGVRPVLEPSRQTFRQFQYPTVPLSVLPHAHHKAAQATAQAVLQADRRTRQKIKDRARHNRPRPIPATGAPTSTRPTEPQKRRSKSSRKRGGHAQR
jgi:hypothetical protein